MDIRSNKWVCDFCARSFARETSLAVHLCEPKRRRSDRDERGVQLAFQAYLQFYEQLQGSSKLKTQDDFERSSYYRAFVKWGRYCVAIKAIMPERWLAWLLKNNKKIDKWATDSIYSEYLVEYLALESVEDALARTMEWAIDWQQSHGYPAKDYLRYGSVHAVCHAITTGKVSPWVIYNCDSGQQFLSNLDAAQISMIWPYIDSDRWQKKFQDYAADKIYTQEILQKAGW